MPRIIKPSPVTRTPTSTKQVFNLASIVTKLENIALSKTPFMPKISRKEIDFCRTLEIPDRATRQKLIELIFSKKLENEPISEAFASNASIISDSDEAMGLFIRLTTPSPSMEKRIGRRVYIEDEGDNGLYLGEGSSQSLNTTAVQKGLCVNKNIIPLGDCAGDRHRREKITEYIMRNSDGPLASFLANNENLSRCEGIAGLRSWAEQFSNSTVCSTSRTAVNIIENLRIHRPPSPPLASKASTTDTIPKVVIEIITKVKGNPRGADLERKDRLCLMSHAESLIGMKGKEEKFVFELMQNPSILTSTTWQTTISKTNFCFLEGKSDHGFVLGLALNEQKNKIDDFREALLELAVRYPHSEFAKNLISGLTEFNKADLQLISALLKHKPQLQTILRGNNNYQIAVENLRRETK